MMQQKRNKFYDFQLKHTNLIVEIDGDFWHCNPRIYTNGPEFDIQKGVVENDKIKEELAKKLGYKIIRIWEYDFKKKTNEFFKKFNEIKKYR